MDKRSGKKKLKSEPRSGTVEIGCMRMVLNTCFVFDSAAGAGRATVTRVMSLLPVAAAPE